MHGTASAIAAHARAPAHDIHSRARLMKDLHRDFQYFRDTGTSNSRIRYLEKCFSKRNSLESLENTFSYWLLKSLTYR